ncbi:MAG: methionine--tRNA ligase, partial [Bacteroidota bacterium]|nr:methionine--tRNA ligase [Bacteroidota bacterium]MDX5431183.1 methionine--tRNA ligase [Bacteroidota bacterium]MDX5469922.1 methionine--tRNA ligase [Bacteroidota bacterium]
NSELVAVLGNFVNRAMVLCHKYFAGKVPGAFSADFSDKALLDRTANMRSEVERLGVKVEELLSAFKFRDAQAEWMNMAREGNRYLAETEPWKLWKTDPEKVEGILYETLNLCARIAATGKALLPETSTRILQQLNIDSTYEELLNKWYQMTPGSE